MEQSNSVKDISIERSNHAENIIEQSNYVKDITIERSNPVENIIL